jgi:hypothetical protein
MATVPAASRWRFRPHRHDAGRGPRRDVRGRHHLRPQARRARSSPVPSWTWSSSCPAARSSASRASTTDNDLGDYNEVSLALFVRERGAPAGIPYVGAAFDVLRGRAATWIWKLPVDQSFTCEAGRGIWGFPKTVERIDFEDVGGHRRHRLAMEGHEVLTFNAERGGRRRLPDLEMVTYSWIDGRLHRTRFVSGAEGVGIRLGGATLALGDHPLAGELRRLGLPARPLMTVWMEHSHARFDAPEPV